MSIWSRPGVRWALPAGVATLLVAGTALAPALAASAEVELPERSAQQLLADLLTADAAGYSGTVSWDADLGLPTLPAGMTGNTSLASLLDGSHTLRVWRSGDRARMAVHGTLGEFDVFVDGSEVWTWSSDENTATHLNLPALGSQPAPAAGPPPVSPEQVAGLALALLSPSTSVATGPAVEVAGRPAYQLVIAPAEPGSLIGSIRIAVDAVEHVPTRVQVYPAGSDSPALEVGFTSLDFNAPDDDALTFTPPPGATVTEHAYDDARAIDANPAAGGAAVVGKGWTMVLVAQAPAPDPNAPGELSALLAALPRVSGQWGSGHLLTSRLFSVLLTDDGRILAGAVDGDALQAAAAAATLD